MTSATETTSLLTFSIAEQQYGLPLEVVQRVFRAVEVTLVPDAPDFVMGVVSIHGRIVPVVSVRRRMGLRQEKVREKDRLVLVTVHGRDVLLLVDSIGGVIVPGSGDFVASREILPDTASMEGVARTGDSLVVVQNISEFLTERHAVALAAASEQV